MRRTALVFLVFVAVFRVPSAGSVTGLAFQNPGARDFAPVTILISFDGWRWDYHTKAPAPNLRSLMARGVRAENLKPIYPSKTFPNHYTIVTGLYPEHHGIVANDIKDPATGRTFALSKAAEIRDPLWWGGEPIWVTAQRQGQSAASMFWPGSEAPIRGVLPRYFKAYDQNYPPNDRVDQVLRWLDLPGPERPTFMTLYFSDTDTAGHSDGPDSKAVRDAIMRSDGYLGRLLQGLERRSLTDRVNLVVVSDHGMAAVNADRVVKIDEYISLDDVEIADINPTLGIFPRPGKEDEVFRALEKAHPRLKVYRRSTTPEHWHYRDHPRIPPIVGVADEGWQVLRKSTVAGIVARRIRPAGGAHGYDPDVLSMRGVFVAAGPAFKRGVDVPSFENVHIYNGLAQILGIKPSANDGDPTVMRQMLR